MAKHFVTPVDHAIKTSTNVSGTLSIDRALGEYQAYSVTGDVTSISITGWPTTGEYGKLILEFTNTGAFSITGWPTAVKWPGGIAPTLTSGIGKDLLLVLVTCDGGVKIRGNSSGQDYS